MNIGETIGVIEVPDEDELTIPAEWEREAEGEPVGVPA